MNKKIVTAISPIVIIILGFLTALIFNSVIKEWAFIPLSFMYWGSMLAFSIYLGKDNLLSFFGKPQGKKIYLFFALFVGLIPASILFLNLKLFTSPLVIILWLLFALINPFFEELYWRGILLEKLPFSKNISIIYSIFFFVISHPLLWGVFSIANRSWMTVVSLLIMGITWSIVRLKTKSLWWCIISHFMVDIFNLAVFCFLNIYIPPVM